MQVSAAMSAGRDFDRAVLADRAGLLGDGQVLENSLRSYAAGDSPTGNPLITELLELAGVLQIASAAWLARLDEDGDLAELLARTGVVFKNEIDDVLDSLKGPIDFSQASEPFRWLSGRSEYVVCAISGGAAQQTVLILRAGRIPHSEWRTVQRGAARAQRLVSLAMQIDATPQAVSSTASLAKDDLGAAVIDLCPFGIVVIDADQRVLLANRAMKTYLSEGTRISALGGRLAVLQHDDGVRLHAALRAILAGPAADCPPHTLALSGGSERPILLSISRMEDEAGHPRACLMVVDTAMDSHSHVRPLADAFALTPVETRLVVELADGRSVQEAALRLRLKVETARTYLKQIFQKTGTHRQLDLVQLLKSGALPRLA